MHLLNAMRVLCILHAHVAKAPSIPSTHAPSLWNVHRTRPRRPKHPASLAPCTLHLLCGMQVLLAQGAKAQGMSRTLSPPVWDVSYASYVPKEAKTPSMPSTRVPPCEMHILHTQGGQKTSPNVLHPACHASACAHVPACAPPHQPAHPCTHVLCSIVISPHAVAMLLACPRACILHLADCILCASCT